jgi:hypothetical protein
MSSVAVGFAWRVGYSMPEQQRTRGLPSEMFVDWTYVSTFGGTGGFSRRPARWQFPVPDSDPDWNAERFGASQVRGLFGGVRSARLARLSEEAERVIGDVITYGLCEVLDFLKELEEGDGVQVKVDNVQFVILGAALPKVVGRLASLRLDPVRIRVAWFCPVPIPKWISERADEFLLIPPEHLREESEAGENWEEERLVRGWCTKRGEKLLLVQQLALWERCELNLKGLVWAEAQFAESMLPREVIADAGQVENRTQGKYAGQPSPQEQLQDLPKGFQAVGWRLIPGKILLVPQRPPGWEIAWQKEEREVAGIQTA